MKIKEKFRWKLSELFSVELRNILITEKMKKKKIEKKKKKEIKNQVNSPFVTY